MTFDAYELCAPELQAKLKPMRDKFEAEEERKNQEKAAMKMKSEGVVKLKKKEESVDVQYERFEFEDGIVHIK